VGGEEGGRYGSVSMACAGEKNAREGLGFGLPSLDLVALRGFGITDKRLQVFEK
jgi:hypothetical protein